MGSRYIVGSNIFVSIAKPHCCLGTFSARSSDTEVNQYAKCGGFWFDVAGFSKTQTMNGQKKQKAIDKYFSIILYKKIKNIHILNEDVGKVVKNIIHIFNYFALKKISLSEIM